MTEVSNFKGEQVLNLFNLTADKHIATLADGESIYLGEASDLSITASPKKGQILIELFNNDRKVELNNQRVYAASMAKCGDVVTIDEAKYVALKTRQTFINTIHQSSLLVDHDASLSSSGSPSAPIPRLAKFGFGLIAANILLLALWVTYDAMVVPSTSPVNAIAMAQQKENKPALANNNGVELATLETLNDEEVNSKSEPVADIVATSPIAPRDVAKPIAKATPHLPKASLRDALADYEEYVLEARFDPQGAKTKLCRLAAKYASFEELQKKVQAFLRGPC